MLQFDSIWEGFIKRSKRKSADQQGEQRFECRICIVFVGGKEQIDNSGIRRNSCLRAVDRILEGTVEMELYRK